MTISEKVSYIKGLAEGMKIDDSTNEGKITLQILDVLNDIALQLEDVDGELDDVADVVGELEESVYDLEDVVYGDDDEDCDCDCDCDDDCDCGDDDLYEITCPKCNNSITVDYDVIATGGIACPNCGEPLEFDLSELEDEQCDCGCDCDCK